MNTPTMKTANHQNRFAKGMQPTYKCLTSEGTVDLIGECGSRSLKYDNNDSFTINGNKLDNVLS